MIVYINNNNRLRAAKMVSTVYFCGAVRYKNCVLTEFVSQSQGIRYVSAFWLDRNTLMAAHRCRAVVASDSCWHLAVGVTLFQLFTSVGSSIRLRRKNIGKVPAGGNVLLSGMGGMKLLSPTNGGGDMVKVCLDAIDIMSLRPELTEAQAQRIMDEIGDDVSQAMLSAGWDVIAEKVRRVKVE